MPKETENKTLKVKVVIKDVITQADLEKFEAEYYALDTKTRSTNDKAMILAGIKAEWVTEPVWKTEDMATMDPRLIRFVGEEVAKLYTEFTTIPKN